MKFKRPYKTAGNWEFWLVNGEVYRNEKGNRGYPVNGIPANARWESSKAHFDRFFDSVYRKGNPTRRGARKMTKRARRLNASKRSKQKRMATALRKFLKAQNPAANYAGAKIRRNKGSITIIPIKLRRASR
jgi:hypothetical protein